jgi:uncharacterized protein YqeY
MSEVQLVEAIEVIVDGLGEKSPKLMGAVMSELKVRHAGEYDGQLASKLVKEALTAA